MFHSLHYVTISNYSNVLDIPPTVHQVLMLDPIPIENMAGRDKLMLECSASGNPAPQIDWSFEGKK